MNAIPAAAADPVRKLPGSVQKIGLAAMTPSVLIEIPTMAPINVGTPAAISRPTTPSRHAAATCNDRLGLLSDIAPHTIIPTIATP
ncbi:hypothetical protein D3C87_1919420 [compost metagenome]